MDPKPTRRDSLEAAFDAAQDVPVDPPKEEPKENKPRDESGKFAKPAEEAKAAETQEDPYVKPPKSWKPDFKDKYSGLDPEVRRYLHQREEEQNRGVEPLKLKASRAEAMEAALEPVRQDLESRGISSDAFLRDIIGTATRLQKGSQQEKLQTLMNIAQSYGISLTGQQGDPSSQILQRIQAIESGLTTQQQQREAMEWQEAEKQIQAFSSQEEKYPHFETVRETMGRLIQAGAASDMESAYTKAVRLHDDIFEKDQQKKIDAEISRKKSEADAAAKAAKAAAVSPKTSSPTGSESVTTAKSRRAALEDGFEKLVQGRV